MSLALEALRKEGLEHKGYGCLIVVIWPDQIFPLNCLAHMDLTEKLKSARNRDIKAFNHLFAQHEKQLKSYLYRLLTNREDVEDFYHNTFVKAFDKIASFRGEPGQFRSWIFTIATRLVYNHLERRKRWNLDAQDVCRDSLVNDPSAQSSFMGKVTTSKNNVYEIKEHIDFCFTCITKTLSIEQQISLMLADIYHFKVSEVAEIINRSIGKVKHYLRDARGNMSEVFHGRCALINKDGVCHQCSELQGIFDPQVDTYREAMKLKMVKDAKDSSKDELFQLREAIVNPINPIDNKGMDLHDALMQHMKKVNKLD